ncbi:MAG: hypothetical protein HY348_06455 [Nitrospira defluvii]|nr:hypothetical protein [Nitrospira defluvii]
MSKPKRFKYFQDAAHVQGFVESELLATLRDNLDRMENDERQHYTREDCKEMRDKIADLERYFEEAACQS